MWAKRVQATNKVSWTSQKYKLTTHNFKIQGHIYDHHHEYGSMRETMNLITVAPKETHKKFVECLLYDLYNVREY
jgi:hypothetical protein